MTPKEKAIELVNSFNIVVLDTALSGSNRRVKQCALITVNEILKQFDGLYKPEYCAFDAIGERKFTFESEHPEHMTGYDMIAYWELVKQEIEKL